MDAQDVDQDELASMPVTVETALAFNETYQDLLEGLIAQIEGALTAVRIQEASHTVLYCTVL